MNSQHPDTAELRERIARERAELGDTAAELVARLDVPARAKASGRHAVEQAKTVVGQASTQGRAALQQAAVRGRSALDTARERGGPAMAQARVTATRAAEQARATLARDDRRPVLVGMGLVVALLLLALRRARR
jgi:hypothetical protein